MSALGYSWAEAVASLWRGRQMGLLSTATIGVALFVLGGFLIVTSNLELLGQQWSRSAEMSVYLEDEIVSSDRDAVEAALTGSSLVAALEYVSKEAALARFQRMFADLSGGVDIMDGNPLPASFEVQLKPVSGAEQGVTALVERLSVMPGVEDVRYDRQWLDRLVTAAQMIRGVGLALAAVLTFAAALTVANVVRLALFARRDEIEIMQLVGAPRAYVRGPFIMEGVLQGGIGALVALAALAAVFLAVRGRYLAPLAEAVSLQAVRFLSLEVCVLLVVGGMVVGCLGGMVASWDRS